MTSICLQDWEIRALQEGRKKQFRVLAKPQPPEKFKYVVSGIGRKEEHPKTGFVFLDKPDRGWPECEEWPTDYFPTNKPLRCPFGKPGDRVFVKETWRCQSSGYYTPSNGKNRYDYSIGYKVGWGQYPHCKSVHFEEPKHNAWPKGKDRWRSPVTMPQWASRFTLLIKSVRVERVNEISEEDARAEGIEQLNCSDYRTAFYCKWQSHHPGSWERGDWVWVAEVERV